MDLTLTNEQSNLENISNLLTDMLFLSIVENFVNESNLTEVQLLENCIRVIIY